MTQLLVSVRSAAEALTALSAGADLIDIKEPSRGALGAADVGVWREVLSAVKNHAPVSAALGELMDWEDEQYPPSSMEGLQYVKIGLAGMREEPWTLALRVLQVSLPTATELVAVAYADADQVEAPPPAEILSACHELDLKVMLIDTFDKTRGGLFAAITDDDLQQLVQDAQSSGVAVVLGGSLTLETLDRALALRPDWLAVRGAVCDGDRTGVLSADKTRELKRRCTG